MKRTHPRYKSVKMRNRQKRQTHKFRPCVKNAKQNIVETLLEVLNDVKIYHWNTHSFAQHKATDELYQHLNDHMDKFVEVLLGKREDRISALNKHLPIKNTHKKNAFKETMHGFREYLIQMDRCLDSKRDSDLLNIRDEILADVNQFLYLLTLK